MEVGNPTFVYHQEELSNKNVVFAGAHITELNVPEICFI